MLDHTLKPLLKYSLLILVFLSADLLSQTERANYRILGIRVDGNVTADANTIIANSGLKINDEIEVPGDATINAIKRLWALNIFTADIEIVIEQQVQDGVFLLIKLQEHPRIEDFAISGNDEIDDDDIEEKILFRRGHILKPQDIYNSITKIKKLYEEEGFLNAEIKAYKYSFFETDTSDSEITVTWRNQQDFSEEYETVYDYDPEVPSDLVRKIKDRVLLLFEIEEGEEVKVSTISFIGNEQFDDDDLKGEFDETVESSWWKFWRSADFNREEFEKDKKLLVDFYRKNGFRDFEVLGDTLIFNNDKSEVDIVVSVFEGPQYKIRNINWVGNSVFSEGQLTDRLGFLKGDIYNFEKLNLNLYFNETQSDISSMYQDLGYLTSRVEASEKLIEPDSVDLTIRITENNRYKINEISISGNNKTKEKVIRRELYSIPGDYYSRAGILRSIQQLANLQYFNVESLYQNGVNPQPTSDSTVAITYNVEEKSSDYLNASVGYSGGFGFSGSIGVTLTNFSLAEPFRLGGGQILNFSWMFGVGNYYRTFTFGFTEPWFLDTPTLVGFDVFDTRQRYVYDLRQTGGSVKVGRRLKWPDNYFYVQGLFRFQYNDIIDGRNFYAEGKSRQYTLGATISRTDIDNPIFPSAGSKFSINGELSGGPLLPGDVDYYKLNFKAEWYKRIFNSNRLAFYLGADIGYLEELNKGTIVQPFEFFFMGGNGLIIATTPLRGYQDRSVGPRNQFGDIIGGRVMTKYTAELRAAITLNPIPIYFLTFLEAGNTFLNLPSTDLFDLRRSAGIGARLLINPLGLIGFDFGYGFDRKIVDGADPKWIFHFQFGKGF